MAARVIHAHVTALPNDGSKDVSATAWNEDHTITGLDAAAVGLTTKAQFNTALTDDDFAYASEFGYSRSTGIISGGVLSIGTPNTKFSISDGSGVVVDNTIGTPVVTNVSWSGLTNLTPTYLATNLVSYIAIDSTSTVVQSAIPFTNTQHRDYINLGSLIHVNLTNLDAINNFQESIISPANQLSDLQTSLGIFNKSGNVFSPNGANLLLNKSLGYVHSGGSNWAVNPKDPNVTTLASLTAFTFQYRFQTGTNGTTGTSINPNIYDVAGVSTAVSTNKFTIQRIYSFVSNNVKIQPGQTLYNSMVEAKAAIQNEVFVTETSISFNGLLRGFLIVREGTTNLQTTTNAFFYEAGKFGSQTGIGGQSVSTLQNAYDNGLSPEILTNSTNGALSIKRGSAADTDNLLEIVNAADATVIALSGDGKITATPAVNTSGLVVSGYSLTGSSTTALMDLSGTWNTSGIASAIKLNITNTASALTSKLLDLQTAGVTRFAIAFDGRVAATGLQIGATATTRTVILDNNGTHILNTAAHGWAASSTDAGGTLETTIYRDAAHTTAQRNSTNAQTSRIYGTYTDASNYVRLALAATSTATTITAETAGTGADDIDLTLAAAGAGQVKAPTVAITANNTAVATTAAVTTALASYQPLDTQLTDLAGLSYAGNTLKVVRVNAGETGFELVTPSSGGANVGESQVDFGAFPGLNEVSVAVTGQGGIVAGSKIIVSVSRAATADHTVSDAAYAAALMGVSAGNISAATGFTIYANSIHKMQGKFLINWSWA